MTEIDENVISDELNPKQEAFCRNYVLNDDLYGNRTLSYADAYGYDLDNEPKDDSIYELKDGSQVAKYDLDIMSDEAVKGSRLIEESSYQKMYDMCSQCGSRLSRNVKVQARCRELINEMADEAVVDSRLREIILRGKDQDSINAIKEFNKLKQRIVEKKDITSNGETIAGFNFVRAEELVSDNAVVEDQEGNNLLPEPQFIHEEDNTNDKTDS